MTANAAGAVAPAATALITPAAAFWLLQAVQPRLVIVERAKVNGTNPHRLALAALDLLEECAALYSPAPLPALSPCGPIGPSDTLGDRIVLSTRETAKRLGCSDRQVRRLVGQRQLQAVRASGKLLVDAESIGDLIAARERSVHVRQRIPVGGE